jgi:hypothetical protein
MTSRVRNVCSAHKYHPYAPTDLFPVKVSPLPITQNREYSPQPT